MGAIWTIFVWFDIILGNILLLGSSTSFKATKVPGLLDLNNYTYNFKIKEENIKSTTPNVGRVAQRKKKFNQFYCLIMILGFKKKFKIT